MRQDRQARPWRETATGKRGSLATNRERRAGVATAGRRFQAGVTRYRSTDPTADYDRRHDGRSDLAVEKRSGRRKACRAPINGDRPQVRVTKTAQLEVRVAVQGALAPNEQHLGR